MDVCGQRPAFCGLRSCMCRLDIDSHDQGFCQVERSASKGFITIMLVNFQAISFGGVSVHSKKVIVPEVYFTL